MTSPSDGDQPTEAYAHFTAAFDALVEWGRARAPSDADANLQSALIFETAATIIGMSGDMVMVHHGRDMQDPERDEVVNELFSIAIGDELARSFCCPEHAMGRLSSIIAGALKRFGEARREPDPNDLATTPSEGNA